MAPVQEMTREDLISRRMEILERLQVTREELAKKISASSLTPEEWDAKDEIEGIEFLLGDQ
jgi:hypothetical protein